MTSLLVCKIRTPMRAWQYNGEKLAAIPDWVREKVVAASAQGLLLHRRSGNQWVYETEWIIHHPNELDLRWYTNRAYLNELEVYS